MTRISASAAIVAILAIGTGAGTAGSAGALPEPVGGCPTGGGWSLIGLGPTIPGIDTGNFHDQNGDGWVCGRVNPGRTAKFGGFYSYTLKDNTKPISG